MTKHIIDTHCHPQLEQYNDDRDAVVRRALDAGITMICVGTNIETSRQAIRLSEQYEGVYTSVGSHPTDEQGMDFDISVYEALAAHSSVVAIGEIGLDYFHAKSEKEHDEQKMRCMRQLELAERMQKPVIIHCRDAHTDMLELLARKPALRGVIHSFNGDVEAARHYIKQGYMLGLNAIVSYSKSYHEMVRSLPLENILVETDAPYLAPAPQRGKRNEPAYVTYVLQSIAAIRGEALEELSRVTAQNARRLFSME
ncbi:MAG: TatD family hydrolase [Candidatus Pacebacteria bacterium]|nr:TatD family hydrolase [Candidatus Paceibacterota bacterium]